MFIPIHDENAGHSIPYVTRALIVLNVIVFALTGLQMTGPEYNGLLSEWGFTPSRFEVVTLLTSQFLHGSAMHLLGNMLFLWIFGDNVEDRMGRAQFLVAYLGTGVIACLAQAAFGSADVPMVGASGAISGVMGLYIVFFPRNPITFLLLIYFRVVTFPLPAYAAIGFFLLKDVVFALLTGSQAPIAHFAHIGGLLAGAGMAAIWVALEPRLHGSQRGTFNLPEEGDLWAQATRRPRHAAVEPAAVSARGGELRPERAGTAGAAWMPTAAEIDRRAQADAPEAFELPYVLAPRDRPGSELQPQRGPEYALRRAVDGDDTVLASVYQSLARGGRGIRSDLELLAIAAERLSDTGHETLAADAWRRLAGASPGGALAEEAHLQLAWLYGGPLGDAPRARYHAERSLAGSLDAESRRRAVEILRRYPEPWAMLPGEGPAMVLRLSRERVNRKSVGDCVAAATGQYPTDAQMMVKHGMGILARHVPLARCPALLEQLGGLGVAAVAVPESTLPPPRPALVLAEVELGPRGVRLIPDPGKERNLAWDAIHGAVASWRPARRSEPMLPPLQLDQGDFAEAAAALTEGLRPRFAVHVGHTPTAGRTAIRAKARLDLLVGDPAAPDRLRIEEAFTRFRFLHGRRPISSQAAVQLAAGAVLARDEKLWVGPGVAALAGLDDPGPFTCSSAGQEQLYDLYAATRYLLARPAATAPAP